MANDHEEDEGTQIAFPGMQIIGGSVEVHEIGSGRRVDRPDIAAMGVEAISKAFEAAGGEVVGPIQFIRPGDHPADAAILEALDFRPNPDDHLPD